MCDFMLFTVLSARVSVAASDKVYFRKKSFDCRCAFFILIHSILACRLFVINLSLVSPAEIFTHFSLHSNVGTKNSRKKCKTISNIDFLTNLSLLEHFLFLICYESFWDHLQNHTVQIIVDHFKPHKILHKVALF